jgi:hypothetical protein
VDHRLAALFERLNGTPEATRSRDISLDCSCHGEYGQAVQNSEGFVPSDLGERVEGAFALADSRKRARLSSASARAWPRSPIAAAVANPPRPALSRIVRASWGRSLYIPIAWYPLST